MGAELLELLLKLDDFELELLLELDDFELDDELLDLLLELNELELLLLLLEEKLLELDEFELLLLLLEERLLALDELLLLEVRLLELEDNSLDLLFEFDELELLLMLFDKDNELLLLSIEDDSELLDLRLELLIELDEKLLDFDELLELVATDEDAKLDEIFVELTLEVTAMLDATALLMELDIELITLLVCPAVAADRLDELLELVLLLELEVLVRTSELIALLVAKELFDFELDVKAAGSAAVVTGPDVIAADELFVDEVLTGVLFVVVPAKPDALVSPAPPPQALNSKMMLSEIARKISDCCIFIFISKSPIKYLLSC